MLENNRDVATSYLSFILPGDILNELFIHLKKEKIEIKDTIHRYLQREFKADLYSKLEQSGRKTDENIKIEEVFTDLYVTESNVIDADVYHNQEFINEINIDEDGNPIIIQNDKNRFVEKIIDLSNDSQRKSNSSKDNGISRLNKFVIIACIIHK